MVAIIVDLFHVSLQPLLQVYQEGKEPGSCLTRAFPAPARVSARIFCCKVGTPEVTRAFPAPAQVSVCIFCYEAGTPECW